MYKFMQTQYKEGIEARYFCADGFSLAIVASVTKEVDWSAYIGGWCRQAATEEETLQFVMKQGCKLLEADARYYFPNIKLPYRG